MKPLLVAAATLLAAPLVAQPAPAVPLSLTRLECGSIAISDFDVFSDTYLYPASPRCG